MAAREYTVSEWWDELERCAEYRTKYGQDGNWPKLERIFNNVDNSQSFAGPNIIMTNGDTLVSALSVPYPYFSAYPRTSDQVELCPIVEEIDNRLVEELQLQRKTQDVLISAFLTGVGVWKIGYDSQFGFSTEFDLGGTASPFGLTMTQYDKYGNLIEFSGSEPGMPWVEPVHSQDFLVPWGTRKLDDAEYCAQRVCRHIEDIMADPKYNNKKYLQPTMSLETYQNRTASSFRLGQHEHGPGHMVGYRPDYKKPEYVELFEIHCRRTGKVYVIATGHDKFLRNEIDLTQVKGLPYVALSFQPNSKTFWKTSDAAYLMQAQLELSDIALQQAKIRRANVLKMIVKSDAFDESELTKLTNNTISAVVKCKPGYALNEAVMWSSSPNSVQQDIAEERVRSNAREMIGHSRNEFGEYEPGGRRTAYEVAKVAQGSDTRKSRRQGLVSDLYMDTMIKVNALCATYWITPRMVQYLDKNGIEKWETVTGEILKGEYNFRLEFSDSGPRNRQVSRAEALQLLPFLANDPAADPAAVRRWLVRTMQDKNFASVYPPEILTGAINAPLQLQVSGGKMQSGGGGVQEGSPA